MDTQEDSIPISSQKLLNDYHKTKTQKIVPVFNEASLSVDIHQVNWEELNCVECSGNGLGGVIKCGFRDGRACVLKGCSDIVPEYFTYILFDRLKISVPKMRVVQFSEEEFDTIMRKLNSKTYHDPYLKSRFQRSLDRPFILVIEYLPAYAIGDLGPARAKSLFQDDLMKGYEYLRNIGEIIAADLFINNCDRIPIIWNHDGNPNNLLISIHPEDMTTQSMLDSSHPPFKGIYAIDSRCFCIKSTDSISSSNLSNYISRLTSYINLLFQELSKILSSKVLDAVPYNSTAQLKRYLELYTGFSLQNNEAFQVLKGIVYGLKRISELDSSELIEIHSTIQRVPIRDWMDCWEIGMRSLDLSFFSRTQEVISSILSQNSSVIDWILTHYQADEYPLYSF